MIEDSIKHVLDGHAPLVAIVASRIDWGSRAQGDDIPCCFFRLPEERYSTIGDDLFESDIEVIGIAESLQVANSIAQAAWSALMGVNPNNVVGTTGFKIRSLVHTTKRKLVELALNGEDREPIEVGIFGVITYSEA